MKRPAASAATFGALLAWAAALSGCERGNTYVPPPPPEVSVSPPRRQSVTDYLQYTGTTKAIESVDLRARVKGFLKERRFQEGHDVKAGDLLLVIEEEPFQARVEQTQAKLAAAESELKKAQQSKQREVAAAQLSLDQALLLLAQVEETRQRNLFGRNAASREDLDRAQANLKKNAAQVEADRANLEQVKADYDANILTARANVAEAKAELRNAEIDLGYCRVYAPISGRISRSMVDVGNLVGDGQATVLATILKEDPIYAYMSVSESDLLRFRKQVREGKRVDYRKEVVPLDLGMLDETGFPHRGRVEYTDPGIDPGTGTIQARGIFPNADHAIVSGLFVRIRVSLDTRKDALLVPERAVGNDQAGSYLLVVNSRDTVERRPVTLGPTIDGMVVVDENLRSDDQVVVNGLQRARPGAKVKPVRVALPPPAADAAVEVAPAAPAAPARPEAEKADAAVKSSHP
jgi:membrane fusion protein (multidrug efflux system)